MMADNPSLGTPMTIAQLTSIKQYVTNDTYKQLPYLNEEFKYILDMKKKGKIPRTLHVSQLPNLTTVLKAEAEKILPQLPKLEKQSANFNVAFKSLLDHRFKN